jgi:hypothetical protein
MKTLRAVPVALTARAVLLALLALIASGLLGSQQASAQLFVNFDIDPDITGNSANTLGTLEPCLRLDGTGGFDGVADVSIDVVVWGDTQRPLAYEAWVDYGTSAPGIVDPVSWDDRIKLPDANIVTTTKEPPELRADARYSWQPGNGIPGDGTILRIDLDVDFDSGPAIVFFSLTKTYYENSYGVVHPTTAGDDHLPYLAINNTCHAPEIDLSVDSDVTSAPTDLVVSEDATLSVSTTGTHTGIPLPDTVEVIISHTVTAPAGCTVNGSASASDSWTGDFYGGGASHLLSSDFTINCSQPSPHVFVVDSQIELLTPPYVDPNLLNNMDTENVSVNVWLFGDDDYDGFTTTVEEYVGTDPLDACPDNPSDDAWPLDNTVDTEIDVTGDVYNYVGRVGATSGAPNWSQRLDIDMSGDISVTGDLGMYAGMIGETCT